MWFTDQEVRPASVCLHNDASTKPGFIGFSMSSGETDLKNADCTSCGVKQDKSAYWAPALYFMHENGDAELVNEVGGMLA